MDITTIEVSPPTEHAPDAASVHRTGGVNAVLHTGHDHGGDVARAKTLTHP
jgi:hypothetical protein